VQDAYAKALTAWGTDGVPRHPGAWLTTTARRRGLDLLRRHATAWRALPLLVEPGPDFELDGPDGSPIAGSHIADDRLRLVFTCCHPALAREARVALTLRLLCGLSTAETPRAFLVSVSTMAARITRAKKKIAAARIPYRVPPRDELPERVDAVCEVVHLLFTTGHAAPAGAELIRRDLVERAHDLARMLHVLLPEDPDVTGCWR
jgi:RNA polymerase sigma-70 factor (ECF subfamily)